MKSKPSKAAMPNKPPMKPMKSDGEMAKLKEAVMHAADHSAKANAIVQQMAKHKG